MRTKWTCDQVDAFNRFGNTLYKLNLAMMGCLPSVMSSFDERLKYYITVVDMVTESISGGRAVQQYDVYVIEDEDGK